MMRNNLPISLLLMMLFGTLFFAFAPGQWTPAWIVNHDKFVHAVVFFGLSVLLSLVFSRLKSHQHFVVLMFFAVLIEWIQYVLANRGFSTFKHYSFRGITTGNYLLTING